MARFVMMARSEVVMMELVVCHISYTVIHSAAFISRYVGPNTARISRLPVCYSPMFGKLAGTIGTVALAIRLSHHHPYELASQPHSPIGSIPRPRV